MIKIRKFSKILLALAFFSCSQIASAAPGALLEQFSKTFAQRGASGVAELASGHRISTRIENNQLMIPVIIDRAIINAPRFSALLNQANARIDANSRSYTRLMVPASRLDTLIRLFPGERLRAPFPASTDFGQGSIVSESVGLTAADGYQVGNLDGIGTQVAVIDLGFTGLTNAINAGELPAGTIAVDFTGSNNPESGTKHGVGVAEHVADMAPGAQLHCLRVGDLVSLQDAADYLYANDIKIANLSVSWVLASYYDDTGVISAVINDSHDDDGVFWTVSSGNYRRKHWRGSWQDTNSDGKLDFSADDRLELTTTASIITGSIVSVSVYLNWNQYGVNNKTDLNLYIRDKNGDPVIDINGSITTTKSTTNQSRFNDPAELVSFKYVYDANLAPYNIVVEYADGTIPSGLDITLFSFNNDFKDYVTSSSTMDPASAHGAFTVGAVKQTVWNNANPWIRNYSSEGPTNDGRQKPDLVAPDGTSSLTYATASGTSFSSPTTAGAAALLLDENGALGAADLRDLLHAQAVDIGSTGVDSVFGYGKLQLPFIDSDSDQLTNVDEIALGTDALDSDTDNDGLNDYQETQIYSTDPLTGDTDSDGVNDYDEVITWGSDPLTSGRGDLGPYGSPDNTIDLGDYLVLTRMVIGDITPTAAEIIYGDLNDNGELDAGDLVIMMRVITGEIPLP